MKIGLLELCVKKFITDSGNPYYIFFKKGSAEQPADTGINFPLFVLTELEFEDLLKQMQIQKEVNL